jgi:hypothetical protein
VIRHKTEYTLILTAVEWCQVKEAITCPSCGWRSLCTLNPRDRVKQRRTSKRQSPDDEQLHGVEFLLRRIEFLMSSTNEPNFMEAIYIQRRFRYWSSSVLILHQTKQDHTIRPFNVTTYQPTAVYLRLFWVRQFASLSLTPRLYVNNRWQALPEGW